MYLLQFQANITQHSHDSEDFFAVDNRFHQSKGLAGMTAGQGGRSRLV